MTDPLRPRPAFTHAPVIAVMGHAAVGKSWLASHLATELGIRHLDICDYGEVRTGRWDRLLADLRSTTDPCIVESCASPAPYRALLDARGHWLVEVVAPRGVRIERIRDRGLPLARRRKLVRITARLPRRPDAVWATEGDLPGLTEAARDFLAGGSAWSAAGAAGPLRFGSTGRIAPGRASGSGQDLALQAALRVF